MTAPWVQTFSGLAFDLEDPRPEQVAIEDIAHALSMQCRYNGHCSRFYSVAEHSLMVCDVLAVRGYRARDQLHGLLHDATEAYVGDLVAPVKHLIGMEAYADLEGRIWSDAIAPAFGLDAELPAAVKRVDLEMLATEAPQLLSWPPPRDWALPPQVRPIESLRLSFYSPPIAELTFLAAFHELGQHVAREADVRHAPTP